MREEKGSEREWYGRVKEMLKSSIEGRKEVTKSCVEGRKNRSKSKRKGVRGSEAD